MTLIDTWIALGKERGLRFEQQQATGGSRAKLHGIIDGVAVAFDRHLGLTGSLTTLSSFAVAALDVALQVVPSTISSTQTSALVGARDMKVGDEAFDEAFRTKADVPSTARTLLEPAVRAKLLGLVDIEALVYERGRLMIAWYEHEDDLAFNAAVLDAALMLCRARAA